MKKHIQFMKGKKALSLLLAMVMMLSVASPALGAYVFDPATIPPSQTYPVELAYNNLFVFDNWARNELSTTIMPQDANKDSDGKEINPYGTLEADIEAGSVNITIKRDADASFGGIYTAHSGDTADAKNNANYYTIDVEPNTTYTFSYTLENTTYVSFNAFVFYFDENNVALPNKELEKVDDKYPQLASAAGATNLNGRNSWSFTTPADTDRIQIRFTVGNTNNVEATGTVKDIVIQRDETLSLGNIFDFGEWSNNENSRTLAVGSNLANGTHAIDAGSITFNATGGTFTNFVINAPYGDFYVMDVKEYTTYSVSYDLVDSTLVLPGVAIAWHKEDGSFIDSHNMWAYNNNGNNYHTFNTPAGAAYMQIAFGAFHSGDTAGSGTFKNIRVCDTGSVFCLGEWMNSAKSNGINTGLGIFTPDAKNNTVTFKNTEVAYDATNTPTGVTHFTNFNLANSTGFYTATVEPNTTYTYTYNVAIAGVNAGGYFQPWFAEFDSDGNAVPAANQNYHLKVGSVFGENQYTFTTGTDTHKIMVVFAFCQTYQNPDNNNWAEATWTIKDMTLCPTKTIEETNGLPHRGVFEYQHANADTRAYSTLPVPVAPTGYVFGGWYTGMDGTGELITEETKIKYESLSVFPKFEPEVTSIEIATKPDKLDYTVGEKLNTSGLSLKVTQTGFRTVEVWNDADNDEVVDDGEVTISEETTTRTYYVNSAIYCTPVYLNTAGENIPITVKYGGQTTTFNVTVLAADEIDGIVVDGAVKDNIPVTNNNYTLDHTAPSAFNRYKITYISDSYVRGIITFENNITEEFFLEPSDGNEPFVSFIDEFLDDTDNTHTEIKSIQFTCLDNELGNFQLKAVATEYKAGIPEVEYFTNDEYKMGIDIRYGGVVSELYDLSSKKVTARVYNDPENRLSYTDEAGNEHYRTLTLVDYADKLDEREASYKSDDDITYNLTDKETDESTAVNLINTLDRGRYLQQSYYGTSDRPYVPGSFNNADWKYNPVQGGNVGLEPSKVIDYEVTDTYIYVKARPMEWEKWSDEHALNCTCEEKYYDENNVLQTRYTHENKCYYGSDVISDTYVEAWYYFDDGMIKVNNRKVDYSGLPEATTEQELPALYLIEPLNHFVYNDVTEDNAWNVDKLTESTSTYKNIEEPEFWGISEDYHENYYVTRDTETGEITNVENDNNDDDRYDLFIKSKENWAAFTASEDADSFGVGVYSPGVEEMYYGVMPEIYASKPTTNGLEYLTTNNYRHAETLEPTEELPTSYIAPLDRRTFRSYEATEYTYYLTTGTADEIYNDFKSIGDIEAAEELAKTKVAVPETVYLNPADNLNGQYYVNNLLDAGDYYNVVTEAAPDDISMYFGLHVKDAVSFTVNVTNADVDSTNDITLCDSSGTSIEGSTIGFPDGGDGTYTNETYSLKLSSALSPGETATSKWVITVTMEDGSTRTHTAYTVLYAPGRTVGAVAEGRVTSGCNNEISSWITGANGVNHSLSAPLGSLYGDSNASGYFKADPLYNGVPTSGGSSETNYDYINVSDTAKYVRQVATNGSNSSVSQSYLGLLAVDKSRYTNTNQIPNLEIGWDALRIDSTNPNNSLQNYDTYYTLGTNESYNTTSHSEAPSGWTHFSSYTDTNETKAIPFRETIVPAYTVSDDMDGKYIHALNQGMCTWTLAGNRYSTAGTSVLLSVTDKSELREAVLNGYTQNNNDSEFIEKLENAATVLGDPSSTQDEIDNAKQELNEAATVEYYALKYDNLFSALEFSQHDANMTVSKSRGSAIYNDGAITINNGAFTVDTETYPGDEAEAYTNYGSTDNYYLIDLSPNTEYVFEYDVTTTVASQAFIFFYNSSGGNGDVASNISVKTDNGAWVEDTESNPWIGNYQGSAGTKHYAIKFTTGANTVKAGFRFGNTTNEQAKSTFSNIKLIDSAYYYENVEYSKTESSHKEYNAYGTLPTLTRTGYTFNGWNTVADGSGTVVTDTILATEHKTIYSQWNEKQYTINYDKNGEGECDAAAAQVKYTEELTLTENCKWANHVLLGWAYTPDAKAPEFKPGETIKVSDISAEYMTSTEVTLYAVWENCYSVYYSENGGSGKVDPTNMPLSEPHIIPNGSTISKTGYTFLGWALEQNATEPDYFAGENLYVGKLDPKYVIEDEQAVYLHAVWSENSYTIVYNANGATGSVASQTVGYTDAVTLSDGTGLTKKGYVLLGWSTDPNATTATYTPGQEVSKLSAADNGSVTLYAVWIDGGRINIAFDNLIDYGAWPKTPDVGGSVDNITDTGFTVYSDSGEATSSSPLFDIEPGKTYRVDIDIIGDGWDVYFFFCGENGADVVFDDSTNRFSSNGGVAKEQNGTSYSAVFTVPDNANIKKGYIRVDANDGPNTVRFENIRVYEDTGIKLDVVNKMVNYDDAYGTLPTPVKYGHVFDYWMDENGNKVDESTIMKSQETVFLKSKWIVDPNFINDDTVVIDYGLPVVIDVLSNDKGASSVTTIRIGKALSAGTDLGNISYTDSKLSDAGATVTLANGTATLNADNTVTYTPTSTNFTAEEVFYYEVYDGTSYYYASVTVIPAASIYYEESLFTFRDGQGYEWTDVGSDSGMPTLQDVDRVGELNVGTDSNNPYGYDSAYETSATYSLGKAKYTSVDEYAWGKEPEAEFIFTGRGFDLFSVTNNDTGALTAQVFKYNTETSEYEQVEYFFVDTYFGYNYENGAYVPNPNAENAMYQVPVMSVRNLEDGYGTYKVIIKPLYSSYFDPNYTSGAQNAYGIYVDSVRIFDPMGENNDVADNAYLADNEFAPQYLYIRDTIISEGELVFPETGEGTTYEGSVFVDGDGAITSYSDALPTNEVYLNQNQSIAFHIVTDSAVLPATVQMGMKLTGYNSNGATVKFTDASTPTQSLKFNLTSATEMFYRVDSILEWTLITDADGNEVYKTISPIVITNTSDTVVSLSTLKWTFGENATSPTALSFMVDMETPVLAKAAVNHINAEENNTPNPALDKNNIAVSFDNEPYAVGDNGTLIITTEQGVAGVTVDGADVLSCETDENGKLKWTYEFTIENAGSTTFNVVARDENGATSETVYAVTYVEAEDTGTEGDGEDTTTPEGDGSDSETGSGSGVTLIPGDELFAHNLVRLIFQFFEKILGMLSGGATA